MIDGVILRGIAFEGEVVGGDCRQRDCLVVDGEVELGVVVERDVVIELYYEFVIGGGLDFIGLVWEVGSDKQRRLGQQAGGGLQLDEDSIFAWNFDEQ